MDTSVILSSGKHLLHTIGQFYHVRKPVILTGIGLGGMLIMVPTAIRGKGIAEQMLADAENWNYDEDVGKVMPLTKKQKAKIMAKAYWPVALSYGISAGCIIAGQLEQFKRLEALDMMAVSAQRQLAAYQKAVDEKLTKSKARDMHDEARSILAKEYASDPQPPEVTGYGNTLCIDVWSGRKFLSDIEAVRRAFNDFNIDQREGWYTELNQLYFRLGLSPSHVGEIMCWNFEADQTNVDPILTSVLDENDQPMLAISYSIEPTYDMRLIDTGGCR